MKVKVEMTDTFGGEANYSWANRKEFTMDENASDLAIVRKAKAEIGMNGVPCRSENFGDEIRLYPRGMCRVIFITFGE